jgi:hypothetical protein
MNRMQNSESIAILLSKNAFVCGNHGYFRASRRPQVNPSGDRISSESLPVPAAREHLMYRVGQCRVGLGLIAGRTRIFRYPNGKALTTEIAEYAEKDVQNREYPD